MSCYKTCPHCGAHLDSGEVCDCIGSMYNRLTAEDQAKVDATIDYLLLKQNTALDADNIQNSDRPHAGFRGTPADPGHDRG